MAGTFGESAFRSGLAEQIEMIEGELEGDQPNWPFILMRIDMMRSIAEAAQAQGRLETPKSVSDSA